MNYAERNSEIWDSRCEGGDTWSQPVSPDVIRRAREDHWQIVLTPAKPIPRNWFPESLRGIRVLCLASGGGQQGPVLAAAGAEVTVFDNSRRQLEKDEYVARREGLTIRTVQGHMQDLSAFENDSFDLIVHPWSNGYVDSPLPVWRECARVLQKGGALLSGFANPVEYIFDAADLERDVLTVRHRIPYADVAHLDDPSIRAICENDGYIWSHTLEDQIQGQIAAGFVIAGFYEDVGGTVLDRYLPTSIATRALLL